MRSQAQLVGLCLTLAACGPGSSERELAEGSAPAQVELDERAVILGDVVERLDAERYVYLRLSVISDSAAPALVPHAQLRWVAVDGRAPQLGERVHVRSLARRSRVWEPALERDFEVLEYVALLPLPSHER